MYKVYCEFFKCHFFFLTSWKLLSHKNSKKVKNTNSKNKILKKVYGG